MSWVAPLPGFAAQQKANYHHTPFGLSLSRSVEFLFLVPVQLTEQAALFDTRGSLESLHFSCRVLDIFCGIQESLAFFSAGHRFHYLSRASNRLWGEHPTLDLLPHAES
jgi:hypothetical protein